MNSIDSKEEKIIMGIDPGTNFMGYGVIVKKDKKVSALAYGVIKLGMYSDHALKLEKIFNKISSFIDEYSPDEVALEAPFYGKNVQSMLKLGRAQGVAMAAALAKQIPVLEYAPKKVKLSITGNGNASKIQVARMVSNILDMKINEKYLDATDALSVAICHLYQQKIKVSKNTNWADFVKQNPNRVS